MSIEMLTLKVIAPLALHQRRASEQFAPTLDYVSGSTIRGAFADLYLAGDPARAQEPDFQQLFLSEATRFSDFLPTTYVSDELTRLRPATAIQCKRFAADHADSLSDNLLWLELLDEHEEPLLKKLENDKSLWDQRLQCDECQTADIKQGKRERAEPAYYRSVDQPEPIKLKKRMMANTAIRRKLQTAAHTLLFSHEVIGESSAHDPKNAIFFRGTITLPDTLRHFLRELAPGKQELAVGYGRSRGLGLLQVEGWGPPRPEGVSLRERWGRLNEAAHRLWETVGQKPTGQYFALTLQSHLALRDEAGQPVLGNLQAEHLGLPTAERCRSVLSAVVVSGWNMAAELPKADTWAVGRGSVLLFRLPPDVDPAPTMARLEEIEQNGVGERRTEGFGCISVCDPFHYHFILKELKGGSR